MGVTAKKISTCRKLPPIKREGIIFVKESALQKGSCTELDLEGGNAKDRGSFWFSFFWSGILVACSN
jgi:hypothetical protein